MNDPDSGFPTKTCTAYSQVLKGENRLQVKAELTIHSCIDGMIP
jgi:hypothetical protein